MRARGFTLLELLAAMAVLAVLGTLSFRGLDSVLEAEQRLQAETRRWNDVALVFAQLGEDLAMAVERGTRGPADLTTPALLLAGDGGAASAAEAQLAVTRLGSGQGAAAQSAPRRVGYRLRGSRLEYLVWPAPDPAPGTRPAAYPMLEGIDGLHWRALDAEGRWIDEWPAQRAPDMLPRAISVRIVLAGGGEITRILAVR